MHSAAQPQPITTKELDNQFSVLVARTNDYIRRQKVSPPEDKNNAQELESLITEILPFHEACKKILVEDKSLRQLREYLGKIGAFFITLNPSLEALIREFYQLEECIEKYAENTALLMEKRTNGEDKDEDVAQLEKSLAEFMPRLRKLSDQCDALPQDDYRLPPLERMRRVANEFIAGQVDALILTVDDIHQVRYDHFSSLPFRQTAEHKNPAAVSDSTVMIQAALAAVTLTASPPLAEASNANQEVEPLAAPAPAVVVAERIASPDDDCFCFRK